MTFKFTDTDMQGFAVKAKDGEFLAVAALVVRLAVMASAPNAEGRKALARLLAEGFDALDEEGRPAPKFTAWVRAAMDIRSAPRVVDCLGVGTKLEVVKAVASALFTSPDAIFGKLSYFERNETALAVTERQAKAKEAAKTKLAADIAARAAELEAAKVEEAAASEKRAEASPQIPETAGDVPSPEVTPRSPVAGGETLESVKAEALETINRLMGEVAALQHERDTLKAERDAYKRELDALKAKTVKAKTAKAA